MTSCRTGGVQVTMNALPDGRTRNDAGLPGTEVSARQISDGYKTEYTDCRESSST
jgi:hypothetical protein